MPELKIEVEEHIEVWTLDGEARRNALSVALVSELEQHSQRVSQGSAVRVVVITGAGSQAFCAGADLKERATMSEPQVREFLDMLRRTFRSFERSDCIFIAAINGVALGGGLELALSCDLRVMAVTSEVGLTETKLGIIPGGGGTQRLPRAIGIGAAKDLILTGRRVGSEEALRLGLAQRVGDLTVAKALAREIAQNAPIALRAAKHAVDEGFRLELDEALLLEQQQYEQTLRSEDRLEGLRAFAEKRKPVFRGR